MENLQERSEHVRLPHYLHLFALGISLLLVTVVRLFSAELTQIQSRSFSQQPVRVCTYNRVNHSITALVTKDRVDKIVKGHSAYFKSFNPQSDKAWVSHQNLIIQSVKMDSLSVGTVNWTVLSKTGENQVEFTRTFPYDALLPQIYTDNSAQQFAIVDPWEWTITFYQQKQPIATVQLPALKIQHLYEAGYVASWSFDGSLFAIATSFNPPEARERSITLLLFNNQGRVLRRAEFPLGYVSGIALSKDADRLMLSGYRIDHGRITKRYYLLSSDGKILHSGEGIALHALFPSDNRAIIWGRRFIDFYNNIQNEPKWRKTYTENKKTLCLDVLSIKNGVIVLRGTSTPHDGEYILSAPKIYWYDSAGVEAGAYQFNGEQIYQPFLHYNSENKTLQIGTAEKMHTLQLVQ